MTDNPSPTAAGLAFLEAAVELGYEGRRDWDFNGAKQEDAAGLYQSTIKDGRRHSVAAAFLTPILNRQHLTVRPWSQVTGLLWSGSRVDGVEYVHEGQIRQARVEGEVILSAGAIESPKLLMLAGVGPAEHLRAHGIQAVADLPGVGQNLQDHPAVAVAYRSTRELPRLYAGSESGLFVRTRGRSAAGSPDLQFHFGASVIPEDPSLLFLPTLAQPQSRGHIELRSSDPLQAPVIRPNYLQSEADVDVLVEGIELSRALTATHAFDRLRGDEVLPGPEVKTDQHIRSYIRDTVTTLFHPSCTCAMGSDDMAVVDPQLRVRGIERLRVVDASVMPVLVNANLNATCIMIGERAADLVKEAR